MSRLADGQLALQAVLSSGYMAEFPLDFHRILFTTSDFVYK